MDSRLQWLMHLLDHLNQASLAENDQHQPFQWQQYPGQLTEMQRDVSYESSTDYMFINN